MNRRNALVAMAIFLSPSLAFAQAGVRPSWAPLVIPEIASESENAAITPQLRACFTAHRDYLLRKPTNLTQVLLDYESSDQERHDCALAAEVNYLAEKYRLSSPLNNWGPLIGAISEQNKAAADKGEKSVCSTHHFLLESARQLDALVLDMVPDYTYGFLVKPGEASC